MGNDTVDLKLFKREAKIRELKQKAANAPKKFIEWCTANKEGIAIAGVVVAGAGKAAKTLIRHHDLKLEQKLKDLKTYDHSTKSYVELKHKLKGKEIKQIKELRERTGCGYTDALLKLDLVKLNK